MLTLEGVHGTTRSRSKLINKVGFKLGSGRTGLGVYFWRKGHYARTLSVAWWKFYKETGRYLQDDNQSCAVISVTISVQPDQYLNTDDFDFKEILISIALKKGLNTAKDDIAALYDYFITLIEKKLKVKYKVLEVRVTTPPKDKYCRSYPLEIIGVPHCYIVRHTGCIEIDEIEEVVNG